MIWVTIIVVDLDYLLDVVGLVSLLQNYSFSFWINSLRFLHYFWYKVIFFFSVLNAKAVFQHGIAQRVTYPLYNQRTVLSFLVPLSHKSLSQLHNFFASGLSAAHSHPLWLIYISMS